MTTTRHNRDGGNSAKPWECPYCHEALTTGQRWRHLLEEHGG